MKIGVFGGTFDPVHIGHTILALECWHRLGLDKVLFVPASVSPFKNSQMTASPADRLNMLRLAVGHDKRFGISTIELDRGGVSYTVDTLREVALEYGPGTRLFFLSGADSAGSLDKWKDFDDILKLSTFVAVARPGISLSGLKKNGIVLIETPLIDVSSTMIRQRVRDKEPIEGFLHPDVADFIRNKGLYRQ